MRKLIFSINISLDGFADHTLFDATADDELHDFFTEQFDSIGICLFGRNTYQLMESYWPIAPRDPNATRGMIDFAHRYNAMPKIVFSRTLEKAGWNNTRLVREDMIEEVTRLKRQPGNALSIGGISAAQTLMKHNLVDEYVLLVHPVIAGAGRRLFPPVDPLSGKGPNDRINLKLVDTKTLKSGVVVLHYEYAQGSSDDA